VYNKLTRKSLSAVLPGAAGNRFWPALPADHVGEKELPSAISALTQRSRIQSGETGNVLDSFATIRSLVDLGVITPDGKLLAGKVALLTTLADLATGAKGDPGAPGLDGLDGASPTIDWIHYIGNTTYQGVTTVIASGDVFTYLYEPTGATVYRHVTTLLTGAYPTEDAFYSNFDGTNLSNIIVSR
jgi:hypothetical protein